MEQNTVEWLEARRGGIGSSDAPIIMGVSPWSTPFDLWKDKCGLVPVDHKDSENAFIKERGHKIERIARNQYELEYGIDMPPTLMQHFQFSWLRASLDGFNKVASRALEIKYVGKDDWELALNDKVPEKYWPQVQHLLMVSGAEELHYYAWNRDEKCGKCVVVKPDYDYIKLLFKSEKEFWDCVQMRTPPSLGKKDYREVRSKELKDLFLLYESASAAKEEAEARLEEIKKKILDHKEAKKHPNFTCGNWRVQEVWSKGRVDYKKVPQLIGVNLDQYRGSDSKSIRFTKSKAKKK